MNVQESEILILANQASETSSVTELLECYSKVMNMICEKKDNTSSRNEHPAAKLMSMHLLRLVDFRQIDDILDGCYTKLHDRSMDEKNPHRTLYKKYREAQDASNLSGIVFSVTGDLAVITKAAAEAGESLAQSPILVCMADKFCQLARS